MRRLVLPLSNRSPEVVEEGELMLDSQALSNPQNKVRKDEDDDESHDYDSLGSLPKGEIARRIRREVAGKRRAFAPNPQGIRLNNNSVDSSSTVRRAAVAMDPRMNHRRPRIHPQDPPSKGNSSRESMSRSHSQEGRDANDVERRFARGRPRIAGYPTSSAESSSSQLSSEFREQLERELDGQNYTEGDLRFNGPIIKRPPRPPKGTGDNAGAKIAPKRGAIGVRAQPQVARRDSLSLSENSSMTSDAPVYSQEDSTYLLYGYADWAELPTHETDAELKNIRQRFLRQNSSLSSNHSNPGNFAMPRKKSNQHYSDEDQPDTEGLPTGFYRRKDGVIQSFGSSNSSSSKNNSRYTKEILIQQDRESSRNDNNTKGEGNQSIDAEKSIDSTKYGTPMAWLPESNSIVASTVSSTNNDSTLQTDNNESTLQSEAESTNNGFVSAIVQSFEETMNEFRTGIRRKKSKEIERAKDASSVSTASTPSSIRRAKVKSTAAAEAAAIAMRSSRPSQSHIPPVPRGWEFDPKSHPSFSESEGYDDSTITTKESRMPTNRAIVDVSRLPEEERPEYLEPAPSKQLVGHHPIRDSNQRMDGVANSILLAKRSGEGANRQRQDQQHLAPRERYARQDESSFRKAAEDGAAEYYPEPTRRGDRVPEMIPSKGAVAAPSVVSDISSLPKARDHNNLVDFASINGYGGLSVDDNITGFIDKMALALRLAVFQPNGCR